MGGKAAISIRVRTLVGLHGAETNVLPEQGKKVSTGCGTWFLLHHDTPAEGLWLMAPAGCLLLYASRRLHYRMQFYGSERLVSLAPVGYAGGRWHCLGCLQVKSLSASSAGEDDRASTSEVILEVERGTVRLTGPRIPQLSHLLGRALPPWQLLAACEEAGLRLMPGSLEAKVAGMTEKQQVMEGAMCADLALLCGNFLVASSRWNHAAGAGPDAALCRLSEITDWEEGGRAGPEHVERIFTREVQEGDRRVLMTRRQVGPSQWLEGHNASCIVLSAQSIYLPIYVLSALTVYALLLAASEA
eukprot:GHUV01027336.1.p1 GENE.GHUV01027336.1~~GHUV01027336.1.p1  ORF type:complete len:302 (+),score=61.41 GHUV01027336.1:426-1331(+)